MSILRGESFTAFGLQSAFFILTQIVSHNSRTNSLAVKTQTVVIEDQYKALALILKCCVVCHHENSWWEIIDKNRNVKNLLNVNEGKGNPFSFRGDDLYKDLSTFFLGI